MSELVKRLHDAENLCNQWGFSGSARAIFDARKRITELEAELDAAKITIEQSLDFEPDENHTIADMANVGRSLMADIKIYRPDYCWNERPSEIVGDLSERITELEAEVHYLTNAGTIECMVRNKSVAEYIGNLEARLQSHSANTIGVPTPGAAPACEQLADNEDAVYAVAYKLCLQDGADEDSAHTLIWEGHPPEPWGEVWMRYEFQARELLKALDERRALMANHQATFQSGHECVSRVSNSDSQMNKQDDTRTAGESDS